MRLFIEWIEGHASEHDKEIAAIAREDGLSIETIDSEAELVAGERRQ